MRKKKDLRTVQVPTRHTPDEVRDMKAKAAARGMRVSTYIRWLWTRDRPPKKNTPGGR